MCLGAIGSQTGGSITRPASYCGLAACKPTFGRVPLEGILPLSATMDHPGPMATCVRDVAILLEALVTPAAFAREGKTSTADAFASRLDAAPSTPIRLGRLRGFFETMADADVNAAVDQAAARFAAAGATVVDVPFPPSFETVVADHKRLLSGGAARVHRDRFASAPDTFLPKIRLAVEEGLTVTDSEIARLIEQQQVARREILTAMDRLDALICPATRGAPPDVTSTGDPSFNAPWSFTGLPVVSIPIATTAENLPLCLQIISRPWEEVALFQVAEWCERM
jgi:aspartyl-tRNA(Asn)/glutamyl-tRNA(Gln) amidotransferase subunit A